MKYITPLAAALVLFIAACGFLLSYDALHAYAVDNGITRFAWMWPLVIDGFMIVISLSILAASYYQEPVRYLWVLAILATGVSIAFNVAHAPATFAGRAVATVAPVALFLAFEVFIGRIRKTVERNGMQASYNKLVVDVNTWTGKLATLQESYTKQQELIKTLREETKTVKAELTAAKKDLTDTRAQIEQAHNTDTRAKLLAVYKQDPHAKQKDVAEQVGVSRQWVSKLLTELQADGVIHVNGGGVVVKE